MTAVQQSYARHPGFDALPLMQRRSLAETVRAPWPAGGPAMERSVDTAIAGVRARIHIPVKAPALGAMLYRVSEPHRAATPASGLDNCRSRAR